MKWQLFFAAMGLFSTSATAIAKTRAVSYDGYKVIRVRTAGQSQAVRDELWALAADQWNDNIRSHVDIVVSPDKFTAFEALELSYRVMHENLAESITTESASSASSKWKRQVDDPSWFDAYHPFAEHVAYFDGLQAAFPDNSELISLGTSYENRSLFGIHLWGADGPGKPAVLWHGNVHAREWITSKVVEYLTLQLITGYNSGDNLTTSFLDRYDFYENRQPPPAGAPDQTCYGRDINRNWAFGWDANPQGASTDPCSQTYKGEAASDTPENQGLDKLVRQLRDGAGIKLFIDWHSYGQYILSPFGYKETLYAPELGKWTKAASIISEEIRDSSDDRTTYTFGPSGATLYTTTGAAPDHVYSVGRAEWSFTIELRDTGDFGFVLPPELIRPTAEEIWVGQQTLLSLLDEEFFDGEGPAMLYVAE